MAITKFFKRGLGNRIGEDINDPKISSITVARARAKRYLDDPNQGGYYIAHSHALGVPHKGPSVLPGGFISITEQKLGMTGEILKIKSYKISGTISGVTAQIEAERYTDPEAE